MSSLALRRGVFIVSLDLELAWGTFDIWGRGTADMPRALSRILLQTRDVVIDELLRLFREYDVPATWAIVGHLFLDHCEPVNGVKHPDMPRPAHSWFEDDWYDRDPASNIEADPVWYGRDIVERIMLAQPRQEIACHSFSHVIFGDEGCSAEVAEAEVRECVTLARELGIDLRSFVFPRSQAGHHQVLSKHGFSCYRAPRPGWFDVFNGKAQRVAKLINDMLALSPCCAVVDKEPNGLWSISTSAYYRSLHGVGRMVPVRSRVHQCVKGIDKAVKTQGVFHLCLHPWNFAVETERLLEGLRKVLQHAARESERGRLDLLSMGQLAERLEIRWAGQTEGLGPGRLGAHTEEGAVG